MLLCTSDKLMDFPELQCTFLSEGFPSPPSRDGWTGHMGHNSVRSPEGMFIVKNISPKVFVYKHIMVTLSISKSKTSVEGCFQVWQSSMAVFRSTRGSMVRGGSAGREWQVLSFTSGSLPGTCCCCSWHLVSLKLYV